MVLIDRHSQTNGCIMETKEKSIVIIDGITKVKWDITDIDMTTCECNEHDFISAIYSGTNITTICNAHNSTDYSSTVKNVVPNRKIKMNKNGVPPRKRDLKF